MSDKQSSDKAELLKGVTVTENKLLMDEKDYESSVTPELIIDSLHRYYIQNGARLPSNAFCGICYSKYKSGDISISLPCRHTFHHFCIENWLKCVKSTCPIDKKSVIQRHYLKHIVNKRRSQLLNVYTASNTNEIFLQVYNNENKDRQDSNCSDEESGNILDHSTFGDIVKKESKSREIVEQSPDSKEILCEMLEEAIPEIQESNQSNEDFLKITPIKLQTEHKASDYSSLNHPKKFKITTDKTDLQTHFSDVKIKFPHTHQLRESVQAIRRSLAKDNISQRKVRTPKEYQDTLEKVVTKLSETNIHSCKDTKKCQDSKNYKQTLSLKNKAMAKPFAEQDVFGKSNFMFIESLNLKNEEKSA